MEKTHIIIILLILIVVILINKLYNSKENITSTDSGKTLSNEAVQNIASVYGDSKNTVTFNNVNITGNLNIIPRGSIIAFNSITAPAGWAVCDGTNGTPDLRGRFIRMSYTMTGANGGNVNGDFVPINISDNNAIDLNIWRRGDAKKMGMMQKHAFGEFGGTDWRQNTIEEMPTHNHSHHHGVPGACGGDWIGGTESGLSCGTQFTKRYDLNNDLKFSDGKSQYFFNTNVDATPAGSSYGYGIMPPYYVLTYIMKL